MIKQTHLLNFLRKRIYDLLKLFECKSQTKHMSRNWWLLGGKREKKRWNYVIKPLNMDTGDVEFLLCGNTVHKPNCVSSCINFLQSRLQQSSVLCMISNCLYLALPQNESIPCIVFSKNNSHQWDHFGYLNREAASGRRKKINLGR